MRLQKESEVNMKAFARLSTRQPSILCIWNRNRGLHAKRSSPLNSQRRMEEIEALHADIDDIQKASEELQSLALQRKEDLVRTKERMDVTVTELRGKVETEFKQREMARETSEQPENEARQTKSQLAELGQTATWYSTMIQKKEEQIVALSEMFDSLKVEHENASLETIALKADIDIVDGQLVAEKQDHAANISTLEKLQTERDELRSLLEFKQLGAHPAPVHRSGALFPEFKTQRFRPMVVIV